MEPPPPYQCSEHGFTSLQQADKGLDSLLGSTVNLFREQLTRSSYSRRRRRAVIFCLAVAGSLLGVLCEYGLRTALENSALFVVTGAGATGAGIRVASAVGHAAGVVAAAITVATVCAYPVSVGGRIAWTCGAVLSASAGAKVAVLAGDFFEIPRKESTTLLLGLGAAVLGFLLVPVGLALTLAVSAACTGVFVGLAVGLALGRLEGTPGEIRTRPLSTASAPPFDAKLEFKLK